MSKRFGQEVPSTDAELKLQLKRFVDAGGRPGDAREVPMAAIDVEKRDEENESVPVVLAPIVPELFVVDVF